MFMRESGLRVDVQLNSENTIAEVKLMVSNYFMKQVFMLKANRRILFDDERVCDAGIKPGSVIFINPQAVTSSVPLGSRVQFTEPAIPRILPVLPPRSVGWTKEAIDERISTLTELGFARSDCERALHAANYNVDRAADFLVSGSIPIAAVEVAPAYFPAHNDIVQKIGYKGAPQGDETLNPPEHVKCTR
jgi:hypothetical protein